MNKQTSPLLRKLPGEIRNKIYYSVLVEDNDIDLNFKTIHRQTGLLDVCTQIGSEAGRIFYSGNTFCISDVKDRTIDAERFVCRTGESTAQQITSLAIRFRFSNTDLERIDRLERMLYLEAGLVADSKYEFCYHARQLAEKMLRMGAPPRAVRVEAPKMSKYGTWSFERGVP